MFAYRGGHALLDDGIVYFGDVFHGAIFKKNLDALILWVINGVLSNAGKNEVTAFFG